MAQKMRRQDYLLVTQEYEVGRFFCLVPDESNELARKFELVFLLGFR